MRLENALALVREVPDFPDQGVLFRDLTPMLADPAAFAAVVDALGADLPASVRVVVALEARGFLFGAAVATRLGLGVVPLRKPGKLPAVADRVEYDLEYGSAAFELPDGALRPGDQVLLVDDVLATGGTLEAAATLVRRAGAEPVSAAVVVEIGALGGRARLAGLPLRALLSV